MWSLKANYKQKEEGVSKVRDTLFLFVFLSETVPKY